MKTQIMRLEYALLIIILMAIGQIFIKLERIMKIIVIVLFWMNLIEKKIFSKNL